MIKVALYGLIRVEFEWLGATRRHFLGERPHHRLFLAPLAVEFRDLAKRERLLQFPPPTNFRRPLRLIVTVEETQKVRAIRKSHR